MMNPMLSKYFKVLMLFVSLLIGAQVRVFAQTHESNKIHETLLQQVVAWNQGDLEGFMKAYWVSDSLQFVTKKGVTKGYQNVFDNYKKAYPNKEAMGTLYFEIYKIEPLSREAAYVVGKWSVLKQGESPEGHFTLLMKRINGEWKIILDHTS